MPVAHRLVTHAAGLRGGRNGIAFFGNQPDNVPPKLVRVSPLRRATRRVPSCFRNPLAHEHQTFRDGGRKVSPTPVRFSWAAALGRRLATSCSGSCSKSESPQPAPNRTRQRSRPEMSALKPKCIRANKLQRSGYTQQPGVDAQRRTPGISPASELYAEGVLQTQFVQTEISPIHTAHQMRSRTYETHVAVHPEMTLVGDALSDFGCNRTVLRRVLDSQRTPVPLLPLKMRCYPILLFQPLRGFPFQFTDEVRNRERF